MADEIQNTGIQFEDIVPWVDDHGDTGLSARLKLKRNFDKIKAWMDANHIDVGAVKEIIEEYGVELFLSKLNDDTAAGFITFLQGLQVGNQFVSGLLGEGGVFRRDADGKVYIEADKLYVRMKAYFDNVEIKDYEHTSGNRIASKAGLKCVKVEAYNADDELIEENPQTEPAGTAYYRLYFRAKDGEDTIDNNFVVGDQAFCDKTTFDNNVLAHHRYWRLVVGRNSTLRDDEEFGYIDLSASDKESGSAVPLAGDDVSQLGNRTDVERQGAIIEFVGGENAPAYQIYQGINTYSLSNKCKIDIGFDSQTGLARMNVAGNFRFGSPVNTGSYIKYDSQANQGQGQLDIKAHVEFTNSDEELNEIVQGHQKKYDDDIANLESVTEDLQKQIDGAIETWFMTGVPTLQNAPANEWTTDDEKDKHIGDLYYDKTTGHGYRFMYDDEEEVYLWTILTDEDVTEALRLAAQAQETADGKRTVYSVWGAWMKNNVNTLEVGDLFIPAANTTQGGITYKAKKVYKCTTDGSATFEEIAYTDDSKFNGYIDALLNDTGLSGDVAAAAAQRAILSALGVGTVVSGGLLLTSLIGMRQYNGGDKSQLSSYTTWAGISGQYDANVLGGGMAAWYGGGMLDKETLTASQISQQGWNTLRWAKGVDRFDGSGYRADGNISWDKNGALTIKNITTLSDSNNKNILNELATFNSAFTFGTSGQGSTTALYITPQVPFESLYIGTSNANKQEVATKNWVNQNFVTTTFFDNIFRLYNGTESAGNKIDVNGTLPTDKTNLNIEAMFGFWTKKYISALGQGDDGTTSYTTLAQLNDVQFGTLTNGDALVYNATLNKWENKQIEVGVDMSVVWDALLDNTNEQINISHITTALSNYITSNNLSIILTGYATSTQLNALEYLNKVTAGDGVLKLTTNKSTEYYVDLSHEHSFLELLDRPDTIAGYGITLTADDIPMLTKSKISDFPTTWAWSAITGKPNSIAGYGILDAKIENGVITLGGNSITPLISETYRGTVVSVGLSVPAGFSVSGTPITDSGTLAIAFASGYEGFTTDLKNKINALFSWFEVDADGNIKTKDYTENNETKHRGFYSPSFISALGMGDDGQAGQGDVTWALLASPATDGRTIHSSYIAAALAGYATQNWVQQQGYITSAQLSALEYLQTITGGDEVATFTTNKGTETVLDFSHEHSWFELLDKPDTIAGLGVALSASDIPNLDWSKITTGKPSTLAGYDITDAVAFVAINGVNYSPVSGVVTLPVYTSTQVDALARLKTLALSDDGVLSFTHQDDSTTLVDFTHEHSFLELLDRPDTIKGYGITIEASDIPNLDWSKITTGKPTTLAGYGITDAKIVDGVITLGASSITPVTSVAMTVPTGFSVSGSPISKTGTLAVSYSSGYEGFTTELKNKINTLFSWFEVDNDGNIKTKDYTDGGTTKHRGFYSPSFISALGQGDDGTAGTGDVTWALLATQATDGRTIHLSYISAALASYLTTNGYLQTSAIADMATQTWVGQQGFLTSSSLSNYYTKTEVDALTRIKAITLGSDGCLSFTWQDNTSTIADYSHEHSWFELLDRPDTLAGYGVTLTADDIPSIPKSKISDFPTSWAWSAITGKPTTVSGYGITDAITTANIGSQSVNYATSAGGVAWGNVSNKPNVAIQESDNNLIAHGNEFNFVGSGYNDVVWFNYRTTGGTNGSISEYRLGNGAGGTLGTIIHSGNIGSQSVNYATSAGSATSAGNADTVDGYHESAFLHLSGGSMSGKLGLMSNAYDGRNGSYGLNCNNSDIVGLNSLWMADESDDWTEGINYYRGDTGGWDSIRAYRGTFYLYANSGAAYAGLYVGNLYSTGAVSALSDIRHKEIVRNTNLQVEQIAAMRSVIYRKKDSNDNTLYAGSIAQDWQSILPQVVSVADNDEHTQSLQYGVAALIAVITTARKVAEHEQKIKEQAQKISELEQVCSFLKKENIELKDMVNNLKIA